MDPNPNIAATHDSGIRREYESGGPHVYLDEHFIQKFHDVDDAIRHEKLQKLQSRALCPSWDAAHVNLSEDPLLSVVIAYGKNNLAIELMEKMPPEYLMLGNFNGDTALHVAVAKGNESVVEAILVKRNDELLRICNNQMEIPLHKAALFGHGPIFWKLVKYGSDAHAKKKGGATVLHCAVMGNAPELALEIAKRYPRLVTTRNEEAVTPLQLMVTIPEAFRSQLHLGPLESLIYECIPLEESFNERHETHAEESKSSVHETSDARCKDDECQQIVIVPRRKFPPNYATFMDMLELACIPVRWARLPVFNILKQLSARMQYLEHQKKNHKQAMNLIAHLARDPYYWDFICKGRSPVVIMEILRAPPAMPAILETPSTSENSREETSHKNRTEEYKKTRWDESPLILGAKMGLHEFVKQILTVCPASAGYLDTEGRNVLQVAIYHGHEKIVDIIESRVSGSNPVLPAWLFSSIQRDTESTILHFAAGASVKGEAPALQMQHEIQLFERVKRMVPKDLAYSRNKDGMTAQELFTENHKDMIAKSKSQLMDVGKTCGGFLATLAVSAATLSNTGQNEQRLHASTAFHVFSHAFIVGLSWIAASILFFIGLLTSDFQEQGFRYSIPTKFYLAMMSFFMAVLSLLVASSCSIYLNLYGGKSNLISLFCELALVPGVCCLAIYYCIRYIKFQDAR